MFPGGKGDRCVGLTTLPPSCADCLEIWEPQPPGTLRACPGLLPQQPNSGLCRLIVKVSRLHTIKQTQLVRLLWLSGHFFYGKASPLCYNIPINKIIVNTVHTLAQVFLTSAQVFLGFFVSKSECWDGSKDSKLLLHASHVALPT